MTSQINSFQITALPKAKFEQLFSLSNEELAALRAKRVVATTKPGFPCRVSLADAEIGEEVILVNYEHQSADSPYRASHAVYVRASAAQATREPRWEKGVAPEVLRTQVLSLRGFDEQGMLVAADVADGSAVEKAIETLFENSAVSYIHIHFAGAGCYAARADRA